MVRLLLCAAIAGLAMAIGWQALKYDRIYRAMDYMEGYRSLGASPFAATATVHVFLDYMTEPSKSVSPAIEQLSISLPKTRWVFHAAAFTPLSRTAAELVMAAGMQRKFLQMHQVMIRHQGPLDDQAIRRLAASATVDYDRLMQDKKRPEIAEMLRLDMAILGGLNLAAIPVLILDRRTVFAPATPMDVMTDLLPLLYAAEGKK